jgi:hypothetical protein
LERANPGDRRPVRKFMRDKTPGHSCFRTASEPETVFALLARLADPQGY